MAGSDQALSLLSEQLAPRTATLLAESTRAHQQLAESHAGALSDIAAALVGVLASGGKVLLFGNGGSAADAQHVAAELVGRFAVERDPWPVLALTTDTSVLTAIANDYGYAEVMARQVRAFARAGDAVVGISTSGLSANVISGLAAASDQGAVTIAFTGGSGGRLQSLADLVFVAPAASTQVIQELHLSAWHAICALVEEELSRVAS